MCKHIKMHRIMMGISFHYSIIIHEFINEIVNLLAQIFHIDSMKNNSKLNEIGELFSSNTLYVIYIFKIIIIIEFIDTCL